MNSSNKFGYFARLALFVCAAVGLVPHFAAADTSAVDFSGALATGSTTPFGWLSAVADFNADGRPDLAVAKRLSNHGSDFRIDVQLSNGRRQSVSFASALPALRVTAVDVDNDHDIDLVVTPLLGHHVIGVWLNDGAGNFEKGRLHDYAPLTPRLSTQTLSGLAPQFALVTSTSRRLLALPPSAARAPAAPIAASPRPVLSVDLPSHFLARSLAPRAPPALA